MGSCEARVGMLPDHPVRQHKHHRRNRNAELLGRLQVDDKLVRGCLLDGQVSRVGTLQDLVDYSSRATVFGGNVSAVEHKPSGLNVCAMKVH